MSPKETVLSKQNEKSDGALVVGCGRYYLWSIHLITQMYGQADG